MIRYLLLLCCLSCSGCPQPLPPAPVPTPAVDAAPPGPFDALVVNCSDVRAQVVAARPAVQMCLATQLPADACMVDLLSTWGPGPLACAVRAEGMAAFARLPTDAGTNTDRFVAKASRLWITSHGIGYKD